MVDPVTIGACASTVLSMASEAALKGLIGEAAKDAYKALKEKIAKWAAPDIEALEKKPDSAARQAVLTETIDGLPEAEKLSVKILVEELANALRNSPPQSSSPIGIDVGRLEAARIQLGRIDVQHGIGLRAEEVKTSGDFELKELNVGSPPSGKSKQ